MTDEKVKFKETPLCEMCGNEPATSFSFFWKKEPKDMPPFEGKTSYTGKELLELVETEDSKKEWKDRKKKFVEYNHDGVCKFAGDCTSDIEFYYIYIDQFFRSPASIIDWLAHMHEKNWFNEDDFFDMMDRFRNATNSFGGFQK